MHDLAGVGENLHDHLQIRTQYKVRNTVTLNERFNSMFGKAAMAAEYAWFKTDRYDAAVSSSAPSASSTRRSCRGSPQGIRRRPST